MDRAKWHDFGENLVDILDTAIKHEARTFACRCQTRRMQVLAYVN